MNPLRTTLAGAAAALLIASPPVFAAPRVAAPATEGEALADYPGAAPVIGVIGIVALISLIMLIGDDDQDLPTSP